MGTHTTIFELPCAYCGAIQDEVHLAETSGFFDHHCDKCGKINNIAETYSLKKMTAAEHARQISDFSGEPYKEVLEMLNKTKYSA
jgi:phage FluMu protein Com